MYRFSFYNSNIKDAHPVGVVDLDYFIKSIRNPKPALVDIFTKIQDAQKNGDDALKCKLKQSLYSFTPATICKEKRSYANIDIFTGLLVLDFDKFETPVDNFKSALMDFDIINCCWKSASGMGVRALIKIPVVHSVDEYKSYFNYIRYCHEFGKVKQFDIAPQNPVLPLFISMDKDILVNENSKVLTNTYILPAPLPKSTNYTIDYSKDKDFYGMVSTSLSKIVDAGHPILRATAYTLGGYVGACRLTESEANSIMERCIREHVYLVKKASTYIKTASDMIKKGQNEPIND